MLKRALPFLNVRKKKNLLSLAVALILLLSLSACGGSSKATMENAAADRAPAMMENGMLTTDSASGAVALPEDRKLIRTITMNAETEELETLLTALEEKIAELGGYVESREVYNGSAYATRRYRHADLVIRIPAEKVDGFVEHVSGVSNVVSSREDIDDVTLTYVDTESRVKALETEQARLLELMEQAETMADLLEIESRLTDVRYELESVASRLKTLDNQIDYATVYLNISEVQEYTPVAEKTTWQRITEGFADSLEGIWDGAVELFVWVLANSPYLVLFGGIGFGLVILKRKLKWKKPARKVPRKDEKTE